MEIARPPDEVFAYLADVDKLPEWQGSAIEARADGPLAEGSRIIERRSLFGREAESELEVTAFEPGRRLALRTLRGPVELTIDHVLEEQGGRTMLQVSGNARPRGALRFAGPALVAGARRELRRDFERLKAVLEE